MHHFTDEICLSGCPVPISSGGLGLKPSRIGLILGSFGFVSSLFQLLAFPHLNARFKSKTLFITSLGMFFVIFPAFIIMHILARMSTKGDGDEVTKWVWVILCVQLAASAVLDAGYSACSVHS